MCGVFFEVLGGGEQDLFPPPPITQNIQLTEQLYKMCGLYFGVLGGNDISFLHPQYLRSP